MGKKVVLREYDTQSKIDLYSRYAQEVGANDSISAVVGCFTGASREAARPVLSRNKKLLFFPTIDEGGECDKYCFMQGTDCVQQEGPLIAWAIKNKGKKVYVVAADYIYGHVATAWTKALTKKEGGEIVGSEFVPLDVSDFSATIRRIQAAKPDVIMSNLVGNNHVAFYRQFAAAGLNKDIQIVSPVFGLGNEETVLSPSEGAGIVVAYSYFENIDTPENKRFIDGFKKAFPTLEVSPIRQRKSGTLGINGRRPSNSRNRRRLTPSSPRSNPRPSLLDQPARSSWTPPVIATFKTCTWPASPATKPTRSSRNSRKSRRPGK